MECQGPRATTHPEKGITGEERKINYRKEFYRRDKIILQWRNLINTVSAR